MKAKDLINLIFKVEESKEIQESIFYTQFGIIGAYFKNHYFEEYFVQNQMIFQLI